MHYFLPFLFSKSRFFWLDVKFGNHSNILPKMSTLEQFSIFVKWRDRTEIHNLLNNQIHFKNMNDSETRINLCLFVWIVQHFCVWNAIRFLERYWNYSCHDLNKRLCTSSIIILLLIIFKIIRCSCYFEDLRDFKLKQFP